MIMATALLVELLESRLSWVFRSGRVNISSVNYYLQKLNYEAKGRKQWLEMCVQIVFVCNESLCYDL